MSKAKQVLCIDPEPSDLRIAALLNRRGIAVDLTEVSSRESLRSALERANWWDLILCDGESVEGLGVQTAILPFRDELDASLVLVKAAESALSVQQGHRLGAADLVVRDEIEHLLMVCERELQSCALRKELRALRRTAGLLDQDPPRSVVLATIHDLSRTARPDDEDAARGESPVADQARVRALIDAGGLTLEFQPIISLSTHEEHRSMFETLVRLKDDTGKLLMPSDFLPVLEAAGWMTKIDLWILRRALATLQEMQEGGAQDAVLFINVATETLNSAETAKALGAFISAARLARGSVVIEVRKSAFTDARAALERFARSLQAKNHGLLIEDAGIDDCAFLAEHRDLITHVKLERAMTQGLVERRIPQEAVNALVQCAQKEGMRVIALAVDNAELLPMLFAAGVDAIQGHFVSMPYQNLMYPSIQRVESKSGPVWQGPERSG
ncbi:EAL domain-containing protein [Thiocapsa sp.]|uniref:EAL domain-containing protein n=1 Tax=Thiocapsa sp. TaxID=2024551 RepID=UPI0025EC0067|nr:EAL domain-containing protein [Thiocapsa sp.]